MQTAMNKPAASTATSLKQVNYQFAFNNVSPSDALSIQITSAGSLFSMGNAENGDVGFSIQTASGEVALKNLTINNNLLSITTGAQQSGTVSFSLLLKIAYPGSAGSVNTIVTLPGSATCIATNQRTGSETSLSGVDQTYPLPV